MKTLLLLCASLALAIGCGSKGGDAAACAKAGTGVETMMGSVKTRMESMNAPPEQIAKVGDAGVKLKDIVTKHCTEDKWSKEVTDCYAAASSQKEIAECRKKLPQDQGDKLRAEEMQMMSTMMGGMKGMMGHGMPAPSPAMGSATAAPAPAPAMGSAAPAPAPAPAGSAH